MLFYTFCYYIGLLAYADNNAVRGNNVKEVKLSCQELMKTAGRVGLQIDDGKTVHTIVNRKEM